MRARLWNSKRKPAPSGCLSLCASQSLAARFHTSPARYKLVRNPTEEGGGGKLAFPTNDWGNFGDLRKAPGMIYWDKSMFIHKLEELPRTLLFCRPRRFGKSYTVSILNHFHGLEFRGEYNELFKVWFAL